MFDLLHFLIHFEEGSPEEEGINIIDFFPMSEEEQDLQALEMFRLQFDLLNRLSDPSHHLRVPTYEHKGREYNALRERAQVSQEGSQTYTRPYKHTSSFIDS